MTVGRVFAGAMVWLASVAGLSADTSTPLVDVKEADRTIVVELRYAGKRNVARRPLYSRHTRAFVRPELLPKLASAQKFLRQYNHRLKIWDAYRSPAAQKELWSVIRNDNYIADPNIAAGSLHSWGVAVDCTLTDLHNREVQMPTDFDDFTPAAMTKYIGPDPRVRYHLRLLQVAMAGSGFYGFRNEWWHFTVKNWAKFLPPDEVERIKKIFGSPSAP